MKYFFNISYNGTRYRGWQSQPNILSVQGTIEDKLKSIFKTYVPVLGCGRTDAGVHASQYVFHIEVEPFHFDLKHRLNKHLPADITIHDIIEVDKEQHARYDATFRTYDYFIHLTDDSFLGQFSSFYDIEKLDFKKMREAADLLTQYKDYKLFCKQPNQYKHTLCNITHSELIMSTDKNRIQFSITANRFLRGMIRLLVSHFIKIGTGELVIEDFTDFLKLKKSPTNTLPAFPNGLYLSKIQYPFIEFENKSEFVKNLSIF